MKTSPLIALIFLCLFAPACVTSEQNQELIATLSKAAGTAAEIAVQADPSHRLEYQKAKVALDLYISKGAFTAGGFSSAFTNMPPIFDQKTLLYIQGGIWLEDLVTKLFFKVETKTALEQFAVAIRDGLERGLNAPAMAKRSLRPEIPGKAPVKYRRL